MLRLASFGQVLFRLFSQEPGAVATGLGRRFEARDLAQVSVYRHLDEAGAAPFAMEIAGEGSFFHAAVDTGFFKSFERCRLGMSEARFDAALGKCPAASARLNQQKLNSSRPHAVADRSDLLALFEAAKVGEAKKFRRGPRRRRNAENLARADDPGAHGSRVHDERGSWLEPSVVRRESGCVLAHGAAGAVLVTLRTMQVEQLRCLRCGREIEPGHKSVAVYMFAQTVGIRPRQKSTAQRICFCPQCSVSLAMGPAPEGALNVAAWEMLRELVSSDVALNEAAWDSLRGVAGLLPATGTDGRARREPAGGYFEF